MTLSSNAELLKTTIRTNINSKYKGVPPTEFEFNELSSKLHDALNTVFPLLEDELILIKKQLKAELSIVMNLGQFLIGKGNHSPWYPARRASLDFYYWDRYKRYLEEEKKWNGQVVNSINEISDQIVGMLGDPKSEMDFLRKGLILGDVQSGKTANYTAICNKAADTGYKVIIVLTGTIENLRKQTQERLDEEFTGILSKNILRLSGSNEIQRNNMSGVGLIDRRRRITPFTTTLTDFSSQLVNSNALTLKNLNETALFVVKKNKSILNNLERWLVDNNADSNGKIDLSLLIIDDEADNASVNTNNSDKDPTAINSAIRSILHKFTKASYLGITATPFANIFIDPESESEMLGDDLFPSDFIYVLSPPSNYLGANRIFDYDSQYKGSLESIDENEMELLMPPKHKKDYRVGELTESLIESICYFVLVNAIRDYRSVTTTHRTMLINITRYTDVQSQLKELVSLFMNQMKQDIRNYIGLTDESLEKIESISTLKRVWTKYKLDQVSDLSWNTMKIDYLHKAISPIEVRAINQKQGASTSLDYSIHKQNGFRIIAIGGDILSRGITLEGLCVSYFNRNTKMYDTLLQMGRWFGYRPGYEDLFKIWMTDEIISWYTYITEAINELKIDIAEMNRNGSTPDNFGLKVRQDPASLMVTARNKMRNSAEIRRPISLSGKLIETPRLYNNVSKHNGNEKLIKSFISTLGEYERQSSGYFWTGISKDVLVDLVRNFSSHHWNLSFQGEAIAKMIEDSEILNEWDVYLPGGESKNPVKFDTTLKQIEVHPQTRSVDQVDDMIKIGGKSVRIATGGVTKVGLSNKEISLAEFKHAQNTEDKTRAIPDSAYLSVERRPLLLVHVLEPKPGINSGQDIPPIIYAIGLGFPGDKNIELANYVINLVELKRTIDYEPDEDDGDV